MVLRETSTSGGALLSALCVSHLIPLLSMGASDLNMFLAVFYHNDISFKGT